MKTRFPASASLKKKLLKRKRREKLFSDSGDSLLGFRVQPWRKAKKRRLIETEKFYLFDVGVTNYLARSTPRTGTTEFGHSFEHFILMELIAYQAYRNPEL